jgi:hypothetical protein
VPPAADARRGQHLLQPDTVRDVNQRIRLVRRRAEIVIVVVIVVKRGGPARAGARTARELWLAPPAGAAARSRPTATGSAVPPRGRTARAGRRTVPARGRTA